MDQCNFGDAILFSNTPVEGRFRNIAIPDFTSIHDYSLFCLRGMSGHIATDFALVVQWDGYIVDRSAWTNRFRRYDYIGALLPRPPGSPIVGNGGFSWRSRRLLQALLELPLVPDQNEDVVISGLLRPALETDFDVRFAPPALAQRFSHESEGPARSTFGFHGMYNLLRYEDDDTIAAMITALPGASRVARAFFSLLVSSVRNGRTELANSLYTAVRGDHEPEWLATQMARWRSAEIAHATIAALEAAHLSRAGRRGGVADKPASLGSRR